MSYPAGTRVYAAAGLLDSRGLAPHPLLTTANGLVTGLDANHTAAPGLIAPPFYDIHIHGARGYDFMSATPAEMHAVAAWVATRGTGRFLATTVTASLDHTLAALDRIATFIDRSPGPAEATCAGIHLEGPFLCASRRGVHPEALLLPPSLATFQQFEQAARNRIRLLTLAPEQPGALELIAYAVSRGIRVSLGHSDASYDQALAAFAAGASSATHTFNAMPPLHHRDPGLTAAVLTHDASYAELIADGVHVHPAMVALWLRMKGANRAILVTDGISATGMPDGTWSLGGLPVTVVQGVCRIASGADQGTLAGSVLTLDRAVANLVAFTGTPLATAVRCASLNPAALLGEPDYGLLTPGAPASFTRFDAAGHLAETILHGVPCPAPS